MRDENSADRIRTVAGSGRDARVGAGAEIIATAGIKVEVTGFRNNNGQLGCSLWPGPPGFPRDDSHIWKHVSAPIENARGECVFAELSGRRLRRHALSRRGRQRQIQIEYRRLPTRGLRILEQRRAQFKAPTFDECKFHYDGNGTKQIPVKMI